MGWERGYYYQVKKRRGKVIREYIGKGQLAELIAQRDLIKRQEREEKRKLKRESRKESELIDREIDELNELVDLFAEAGLISSGYHQHDGGEWRKKRG